MDKAKAELIAGAEEDKAFRDKEGYRFQSAICSTTDYKTAGQSPRLLSLSVDSRRLHRRGSWQLSAPADCCGIASAAKEIEVADLFAAPGNMDRLLTQRWCDALNKAREEKRGEPMGGDGMFDECPSSATSPIVPADKDGNGRFERLILAASPMLPDPMSRAAMRLSWR